MIELYCDESRQDLFYNKDAITNTNRFMAIGGIVLDRNERLDMKQRLNLLKEQYQVASTTELKWCRVNQDKLPLYKAFVASFFEMQIGFRTILIDATKVDLKMYHEGNAELGFYKFYYQLLCHWLEELGIDQEYTIYTDMKSTKSGTILTTLLSCLNGYHKVDLVKHIYAIESRESVFLQLEDILMGAVAYKFNYRGHGVSNAKEELVEYIEQLLGHSIVPTSKTEKKFNIFQIRI